MSKLRVNCFCISVDGFGAALHQDLANPFGVGGMVLPAWMMETRTFKQMRGLDGGETGINNAFAVRGMANLGAWILGRNMFSPHRGPWTDLEWRGWWGDNPPYHTPVFVHTHHPRPSLEMEGGTVFHFVNDDIETVLARAREAAGDRDVRLGGGTNVVRQYWRAALIDELHLAVAPVMLGAGEHLFTGINAPALGYNCTEHVATDKVTHIVLTRQPQTGIANTN